MNIEEFTICPGLMDCFIARKNNNGTMFEPRKALNDEEMEEVIAFYGSTRLKTGWKLVMQLRDGTSVSIAHRKSDKDLNPKAKPKDEINEGEK